MENRAQEHEAAARQKSVNKRSKSNKKSEIKFARSVYVFIDLIFAMRNAFARNFRCFLFRIIISHIARREFFSQMLHVAPGNLTQVT